MRKYLIKTLILIVISNQLYAQQITFFQQELTSFDSIKTVDDWKNITLDKECVLQNSNEDLRKSTSSYTGWQHEEYKISYKGIPIEYSMVKVHKKDGEIKSINGEYYKDINLSIIPTISEKTAIENAKNYINAEKYIWDGSERDYLIKTKQEHLLQQPKGELVICSDYLNSENINLCLAYKFDIYAIQPLSRNYVYVDANTGNIIHVNSRIKDINTSADTRYSGSQIISTQNFNGQFRLRDYDNMRGDGIETYNLNNGTNYSSATDFTDNDNNWTSAEYNNTAKDNAALDAHWGAMMTYDYFEEIHGRNSFDNQGTAIQSYVHYSNTYENAFWNGSVMTYGDGGSDFDALTSLDIVAHEIGHGVTEHSANLVYQNESGAINESISDIWAACIENYVGGGTFFVYLVSWRRY